MANARSRILVVDDEAQIRELLQTALTEEGYDVRGVGNGAEALSVALTWRPDAIVLDLLMPVMNGWQFAEAYGAQLGDKAPIVVVTAAGPGAIQSTSGLGVISAVLTKPVDLDELEQTLSFHLSDRGA